MSAGAFEVGSHKCVLRGASLALADRGRLSERLEKLAVPDGSTDNGSRPAIDIPAFVRELSGPPTVVAHAVSDLEDGPDGRDAMEGAISPDAFLRIASGVGRAETEEKPLPPLPSDVSPLTLVFLRCSFRLLLYALRGPSVILGHGANET